MLVVKELQLYLLWTVFYYGNTIPEWQRFEDVSQEMVESVMYILTSDTKPCEDNFDQKDVSFWFVLNNRLIQLTDFAVLDDRLPTVYIAHGWRENKDSDNIRVIWQNYTLLPSPKNLIVVDWSKPADQLYPLSACDVSPVGKLVGRHICDLNKHSGIELSNVHLIGHSLGAHVTGYAGRETQVLRCGTVGRITGLDPAGPLFQDKETFQRLAARDANFVDVIHTNQGFFGYIGPVGDIDFYVNCGTFQPGCSQVFLNISGLPLEDTLSFITCSHKRSCYLFAQSITKNEFVGVACPTCGLGICIDNIIYPDRVYMGESCTKPGKYRNYEVKTQKTPPYFIT